MNRELKFRAWDTKNKNWMEFVPPREYMIDSDEWDRRDCDDGSGESCLFFHKSPFENFNNRIIYQQYTGLKDKNGKEIYEGDIVKGFNFVAEVYWDSYQPSFQIKTSNNGGAFLNEEYMTNFEIIGNIFENQNLTH